MKPIYLAIMLSFILFSCADQQAPDPVRGSSPDRLYGDYQVWAEEGGADVTIRVQFRQGDAEGNATALEQPQKLLLDGQALLPDSTRFMGVYYEKAVPLESFNGQHTLVFVDKEGKQHSERFVFQPFSLSKEIEGNIPKRPFQFSLENFPDKAAAIRLVMVDTSLQSAGVNEKLIVENGLVEITSAMLNDLTKGPVTLELLHETERPLKRSNRFYGRFMLTYGLRRQFTLVE